MIGAILFFLLFGALSYTFGCGMLDILRRSMKIQSEEKLSFPWVMTVGMVLITSVATLLHFFIPLNEIAIGAILVGSIFIARWKSPRHRWRFAGGRPHWLFWILAAAVALAVLGQSILPPTNPDTGIYHAQTIRWIEEFRIVPGLGNLNSRFAYNSSWLLANALFSFAFSGIQSFHLLPAAFFMIVMLIFLEGASGWLQGKATAANIFKTLSIPCAFYVMGGEISSPGTDLPVVLVVWLLAAGWLERMDDPRRSRPFFSIALFMIAVFAMTVKLSAAPLLLYAGLLLVERFKDRRILAGMIALALFILLPWMGRSVILSGYPLFPIPGVPGFDVDWRIPQGDIISEQLAIVAWGRNPRMGAEDVMQMALPAWLKMWFFNLTTNRKIVMLLAGASPVLLGIFWGIFRRKRLWDQGSFWVLFEVLAINITGAFYWLFTSPDFRFGYGYLIGLMLLGVSVSIRSLTILRINSALVILLILAYQLFFMIRSFEPESLMQRLMLPADYPTLPTYSCDLKNATVFCPEEISWSQCWYQPFPCAPFPRPDVELRGSGLQDGFRKLR